MAAPPMPLTQANGVMRCGQAVVKEVDGTYTPETKLGEH